jgi:hypothetical protein
MKPVQPILHRLMRAASVATLALAFIALQGCVPCPVYTAPPPSKFDRVWDAAYGAYYTFTKTGLQVGVAVGRAKFWKDREPN